MVRHPMLRSLGLLTLSWTCVGILFVILRSPQDPASVTNGFSVATLHGDHNSGRPVPSFPEEELRQEVVPPHLPVHFLSTARNVRRSFNKSCAILPALFDLKINNVYWQHFVTDDGTNFYLYGAYHDRRPLAVLNRIRILAMVDRIPPPTTFCHFWRHGTPRPSFSSNQTTYHYIWKVKWGDAKNGTLQPVLLNCPTSSSFDKEADIEVVSLVERLCDNATNALRLDVPPRPQDRRVQSWSNDVRTMTIAVCVKGLNYLREDRSARLVEWLELVRILGASRVFMYDLGVHANMAKVLRHYERQGFVDVRPLTLPGDQMNQPRRLRELYLSRKISRKRQNELIPYNDCLYRNVGRYDYVVLLDTDEVIVPVLGAARNATWQQLIKIFRGSSGSEAAAAAICAQNVYFFDNYGASSNCSEYADQLKLKLNDLHMLSHVRRSRNYTKAGQFVKCFHDTGQVITLHNHFPMACGYTANGQCRRRHVNTRHGRLQHYRNGCAHGLDERSCTLNYMSDTVVDTAIWRYGRQLVAKARAAMADLGLRI